MDPRHGPWQTFEAKKSPGPGGTLYRGPSMPGQEERAVAAEGATLGGVSLGRLCADLGPELMEVVVAPRGLEAMITDIALFDPLAPFPQARVAGQLLLAVGLPADEALAARLAELSIGGLTAAFYDKLGKTLDDVQTNPDKATARQALMALLGQLTYEGATLRFVDDGITARMLDFFGGKRTASGMAWSFLFDIVHHRGQISTYLRPMGAKVPQIYGPSHDEP